jgi:catechol 2,3-dioxygenase-like lactoylglutathione lyase family enzyme
VAAFEAVLVARRDEDKAFSCLMGVPGAKARQTILRIGEQEIALLAFDPPGQPYPVESTSSDLWFQHFAIIVADMDAAYARLQRVGSFVPISRPGPRLLPPASGCVTAFKFRDAEGHPLELLSFPEEGWPEAWAAKRRNGLFLGIDHTAISVGDAETSIRFFEQAFGLTLGMRGENEGPAQSAMDGLPDAKVSVIGMMPKGAPPHVELLGYQRGHRRPIDAATRSDAVAATHVVLETGNLAAVAAALEACRAPLVSPGIVTLADRAQALLALDPDGHRFVVTQKAG